jgi:hypothetical protein
LVQLAMRDPAVTVDELGLQVRNTKVAWPEITEIALVQTSQRLWAVHRRQAVEIEVGVTPQAQRRLDRGADRRRNGPAGLIIPGTYDFDPEAFVSWLQELRGHYGSRRLPWVSAAGAARFGGCQARLTDRWKPEQHPLTGLMTGLPCIARPGSS